MIYIEEVLKIHSILISEFGGTNGVRDINLLESAINKPFAGIDHTEFYPTVSVKASTLIEKHSKKSSLC